MPRAECLKGLANKNGFDPLGFLPYRVSYLLKKRYQVTLVVTIFGKLCGTLTQNTRPSIILAQPLCLLPSPGPLSSTLQTDIKVSPN